MVFKDYCIILMANTLGGLDEINRVSKTIHGFIDAKGVLMVTFTTNISLDNLKTFFQDKNRNFFIFDLDEKSSAVSLVSNTKHDTLFGFLSSTNKFERSLDIDSFIINSDKNIEVKEAEVITSKLNKLNKNEIEEMSPSDKQKKLDELIEFGLEKLSEHDKNLLRLLC